MNFVLFTILLIMKAFSASVEVDRISDAKLSQIIGLKEKIFATGQINKDWIIKVSHDRGQTWKTVFRSLHSQGLALNIDPKKGILYSAGKIDGVGNWVIIKSSDFGKSWEIVDNFKGNPENSDFHVSRISISGNGYISAVGANLHPNANRILRLRRSQSSGKSWVNIPLKINDLSPENLAADVKGSLLLTGIDSDSNVCLYSSENGKHDWRLIDKFGPEFKVSQVRSISAGIFFLAGRLKNKSFFPIYLNDHRSLLRKSLANSIGIDVTVGRDSSLIIWEQNSTSMTNDLFKWTPKSKWQLIHTGKTTEFLREDDFPFVGQLIVLDDGSILIGSKNWVITKINYQTAHAN